MRNIKADIEDSIAETKAIVGCDDSKDHSRQREFWRREEQKELEPKAILDPVEYDGAERLGICCTQTDLGPRAQRKLVERWCSALPTFKNVRWLYFYSRVSQELFEAACALPRLCGLYVKWSGIRSLEPIHSIRALEYLKLGSSASIESVEPLTHMRNLKWLQVENIKSATSLEPFGALTQLEAFGFVGEDLKTHWVDSFSPLAVLKNLTWLHLGAVQSADGLLQPLSQLRKLQFLGVANKFSTEEFARLSLQFSPDICEWLQPYSRSHSSVFPCRKCAANWKVITPGKGSKLLCPTCDTEKLAKHIVKFRLAVEQAKNESADAIQAI
ncbi:MAG: hypothetical protein KDI69_04630 [Xanthomonadales bacterium]|nr:hypothetical protein [Xanthomonadales bacterium]